MSTYKTKNPLGSAAVKDLYDNAENVDKFVNDRTKEELEDRLGVLRKTWHGMEMIFSRFIDYITGRGEQAVAAIGWQELGNWAVGLAVDNRQQIVYYNGSWYKYLGELEHVIAGDSPENDGGVWSAANPTGKWSNIGDAALRSNLGSSESDLGGALVNIGQATVRDVVRANILSYMSKTDQLAIKGGVGTEVVVDYALRAAIDDGVTVLECPPVPGIYVFGQSLVTLPIGFSFEGKSRRTYTATSDASFNNVGTVFRLFNGASAIFKLTSRHTFRQVVFDGRDKSVRFMQGDDQTQWCRFYDCGIHRWSVGTGNSSPNGYSATLIVFGGTI
ncbi:hypothetical protein [Klebsiella pneumoniae]|nr:hypothetical protein [Klebsiella pneumoniae]